MKAAEILASYPGKSALVVGDICLDRWCTYDPALSEPSRETGIPRLAVISTESTPGGGGTVANNLVSLGIGRVATLSAMGADGFSQELAQALHQRGISAELMIRSSEVATFTYTKLINAETGIEDQPRLDFVNTGELPAALEQQLLEHLRAFATEFDVIFVSDQAETRRGGVVTPAVRNALAEIGVAHPDKVIWVDSRLRSELFRNVVVKSNQQEAEAACHGLFGAIDYPRLRQTANAKLLYVTHGANGVLVISDEGEQVVPTKAVGKPVDICGAGDSFSAGAGIALAISGSHVDAARFGNLVASITIMKKGTGSASPQEVLAAADELGW